MTTKHLKSVETFRFSVELLENAEGQYILRHQSKVYGEVQQSEVIRDLGIASFLFDIKVDEYEGN